MIADEQLPHCSSHYLQDCLATWSKYQFDDTSRRSPIRLTADVNDNRRLRTDGSNLAAGYASVAARLVGNARARSHRGGIPTPEEIDDSPQTTPSKRIAQIVRGYDKPFMGNLAILQIGLPKIRSECRHFDDGLTCLEHTAAQATEQVT